MNSLTKISERLNYRTTPYYFSLKKIEWSLFVTLTFRHAAYRKPENEGARKQAIDALFSRLSASLKIQRKHFQYYYCTELTEVENAHLHLLLARHPRIGDRIKEIAERISGLWQDELIAFRKRRGKRGLGGAKVFLFDPSLKTACIAYITKLQREESDRRVHSFEKFEFMSLSLRKRLLRLLPPNSD